MASLLAKSGWDEVFPIKLKKIFEKFKNAILASFLAKPGQEMPKKRKKNSFWVPFLLDLGCCTPQKIKTNSKKIEKIKKHHYSFISSQTQLRQAEKGGKKISFQVPFLLDLG